MEEEIDDSLQDQLQRAIEPIEEDVIEFQGRKIDTARLAANRGFVSFNSLCTAFHLDRRGQRQRLDRMNVFQGYSAYVRMSTPKGKRPTFCLAAEAVPLFLSGVETNRMTDQQAAETLEAFQQEVLIILAEHFGISERGEMQFLQRSVARMVAEQSAYEENVSKKVEAEVARLQKAHEEKVQQIRDAFAGLRKQVHTLEEIAGPRTRITPEQLGQLRETVMILGELLIRAGQSTRPWMGIYTDITLQFGVARSEDITQGQFPEVLRFLDRQIQALRQALAAKEAKPGPESAQE